MTGISTQLQGWSWLHPMDHPLLYKELGRLLHAMAAADGHITTAETQRLHEVVQGELVPMEPATDTYGTDQAWITEFEFDVLTEKGADAHGEFDSFIA